MVRYTDWSYLRYLHSAVARAFSGAVPYFLTLFGVLVAAGLQWTLGSVTEDLAPFVLCYPVIMLSGWYGGLGPSLLATGLSSLAGLALLTQKTRQIDRFDLAITVTLALFILVGVVIVVLIEFLRRERTGKRFAQEERLRLFEQVQNQRNAAAEARIAAEEASRAKDEFLATVSHELRTPLTAILGWARLLRTEKFDQATIAEGLEAIERNAYAQTHLVDDLLDMSRIIAGKLRVTAQRVDLAPVIDLAVESMLPVAQARQIDLVRRVVKGAGLVLGDPIRLQQVVWNLVSNAIKFTPAGGTVTIALRRRGPMMELTVADTGNGIDPAFMPHLFDRFRQSDGSTTRRHGGLGVGLAIVRHLVELHGGVVRAASEGPGKGATFTVELPVATAANHTYSDDNGGQHPGESLPGQRPKLDGLRVLVVDDEKDTRGVIRVALEGCRAQVTVVDSAAAALKAMPALHPDVLISDIGMPEMDGYMLIKRIRALDADSGGQVPAIALTAFTRAEDRNRALGAGFQKHIAKPVEPGDLVLAVADLAGRNDVRKTSPIPIPVAAPGSDR